MSTVSEKDKTMLADDFKTTQQYYSQLPSEKAGDTIFQGLHEDHMSMVCLKYDTIHAMADMRKFRAALAARVLRHPDKTTLHPENMIQAYQTAWHIWKHKKNNPPEAETNAVATFIELMTQTEETDEESEGLEQTTTPQQASKPQSDEELEKNLIDNFCVMNDRYILTNYHVTRYEEKIRRNTVHMC